MLYTLRIKMNNKTYIDTSRAACGAPAASHAVIFAEIYTFLLFFVVFDDLPGFLGFAPLAPGPPEKQKRKSLASVACCAVIAVAITGNIWR